MTCLFSGTVERAGQVADELGGLLHHARDAVGQLTDGGNGSGGYTEGSEQAGGQTSGGGPHQAAHSRRAGGMRCERRSKRGEG